MRHPRIAQGLEFSWRMACAVCLLVAVTTPMRAAADILAQEYMLKAAFIFNFTKYVTWPESAYPAPGAPIDVCVIGKSPFGGHLEAFDGEQVPETGRRIRYRAATLEESKTCHVLFVGRSEAAQTSHILTELSGHPVLTVADHDRFSEAGGIVNLVVRDDRIKLQINRAAAEAAGLSISSRLLRLAEIVQTGGRQ